MAVGVCFDYGLRGKSWYTILASLGTGVVLGVALPAVVAFWTGSFELYFTTLLSLSHRPVGELTNTGVGAMGLKRGRPVRLHRPLVGPQKGRLLS